MKKLFWFLLVSSALNAQSPWGVEFDVRAVNTGYFRSPVAASLPGGGFVVCWVGWDEGLPETVYCQRFNNTGTRAGSEFPVSAHESAAPAIAALSDGRFVVCWQTWQQDGSGHGIAAQLFDESGNRIGDEFKVNSHTPDFQTNPIIGALRGGDFVVLGEHRTGRIRNRIIRPGIQQ